MSLLNLQLWEGVTAASWRATIFLHWNASAAICVLLVASCNQPAEQEAAKSRPPAPAAAPAQLLLDGAGLIFSDAAGTRRVIAFGSPESGAVAAARAVNGEPEKVETLEECGAGRLQVSRFAGLTLAAQDGKFAGWWVDGRHKPPLPATAAGIGIGSTRAELEAAFSVDVFESSIGEEFTAGALAGLIDGKGERAKITHLWAGATCIMR